MFIDAESRAIQLTQGKIALVDVCDFEDFLHYSWHAMFSPITGTFYARRGEYVGNGKTVGIAMHRQVMGLKAGDGLQVDHINRDTLDNRRRNLRIATASQQMCNQRLRPTNTTGFRGVSKIGNVYRATIKMNGVWKHLGCRPSAEQAYYDLFVPAARELQGEFAQVPRLK